MKLNPKAILQSDEVSINLNNETFDILINGDQVLTLSYNDITIMEAVLLKLKFADPVISPGKSTGDIFKLLEQKESQKNE